MRTKQQKTKDVQDVICYVSAIRGPEDKWRNLVLDILGVYLASLQQDITPFDTADADFHNEVLIVRLLANQILKQLQPRLNTMIR